MDSGPAMFMCLVDKPAQLIGVTVEAVREAPLVLHPSCYMRQERGDKLR